MTFKLNSDRCLYCDHPRSAHDSVHLHSTCVGDDGGCDCTEFAEDDENEGDDDDVAS